ncbi:hypothetical protein AVI48_16110 (plasmid) [Piscirickettsia salmonis]|uniref:gp53-like domain-containing protein n=1 Tax=Piscirickettsia salmonis TaxID=1238 RepID=UPI00094A1E95|nr:hypothetical protein [Piscirickettsia salmonis]APS45955.1 hypothetical protein AVI48_16110 [Piscirickettsia salmonis]
MARSDRATPFVCANANPFFSADNGDQFLHTYNPHNHTIDQVFVEPDHNEITKQLSYYLGGFDDDGNRHGMTLLSYAKPRFMKVTVTRNPEHNNISFTLTGTGDQYSFASGTTTAFIGLFGVEKGNVTWRDGTRVDENKIITNVRSYIYRGPNAQGYGGAYHYDYFDISVDDGVDELVFYLCGYINCAGYARHWNEVAIPATVTQSILTGDTGYRVDRVTGEIEQWGTVIVNASDENSFYVNFPRSFDHECTNVLIMPYEDTENILNNMVPVLIGTPEEGRFKMRFQWNGNGTPKQTGFIYRARGGNYEGIYWPL